MVELSSGALLFEDLPPWRPSTATTLVRVATPPTLYQWAGGMETFSRMINAFYDRVEQDELLSPFFPGGVHEDHRRHVAMWWGEVFGGPAAVHR